MPDVSGTYNQTLIHKRLDLLAYISYTVDMARKKPTSTFGGRLRKELLALNMTQLEFAETTGINYTQFNRYILNQAYPDHKCLMIILRAIREMDGNEQYVLGL